MSHFLCDIKDIQWNFNQTKVIFSIKANRFLRGMVRCIVGTLIQIGKNKISIEELISILNSGNRQKAGYSVPAKGLFLASIEYPSDIYLLQ